MKKIILGLFMLTTSLFAKETILVQGAMDIETEYLIKATFKSSKRTNSVLDFLEGRNRK